MRQKNSQVATAFSPRRRTRAAIPSPSNSRPFGIETNPRRTYRPRERRRNERSRVRQCRALLKLRRKQTFWWMIARFSKNIVGED